MYKSIVHVDTFYVDVFQNKNLKSSTQNNFIIEYRTPCYSSFWYKY